MKNMRTCEPNKMRGAQRNWGECPLQPTKAPKDRLWRVLSLLLFIQLLAACSSSLERDPFAKEYVSRAEYQKRLTTVYKPWWESLTESERLEYRRLWQAEAEFGLKQMRLGAQMMSGGPIY